MNILKRTLLSVVAHPQYPSNNNSIARAMSSLNIPSLPPPPSSTAPAALRPQPSPQNSQWSQLPPSTLITRAGHDGSPWPWHCFTPADSYSPDLSIDVSKHYTAQHWIDKLAHTSVTMLRVPRDLFFQVTLDHTLVVTISAHAPATRNCLSCLSLESQMARDLGIVSGRYHTTMSLMSV